MHTHQSEAWLETLSLINNSSLSPEDKNLWRKLIAFLKPNQFSVMNALLQQLAPEEFQKLTNNAKAKIQILEQGDQQAWQSFIQNQEKKSIQL